MNRNPSYDNQLKHFARELRSNATRQEQHLWYDFLKNYPVKFRRQRPIEHYIADFYCPAAKLVIELDGSQHFSENGEQHDHDRTETMEQLGITVLRFTNTDIDRNFAGVCEVIDLKIKQIIESKPPQSDLRSASSPKGAPD